MTSRHITVLLCSVLVLSGGLVAGCADDTDRGAAATATSSSTPAYRGTFRVDTVAPAPPEVAKLVSVAAVQEVVDAINDEARLRRDVTIELGGDEDGPFYDPQKRTIQYPWAFVAEARRLLATRDYAGAELAAATRDAVIFVLAHEMGHAVIDQRDLPVLGKEEDAADGFASVVAVAVLEEPDMVIGASDLFGAWDDEAAGEEYSDAEFFDSHSLDAQRFYTVSCWVYGADPKAHANVVDGLGIDEERLDECVEEWDGIETAWATLLDAPAD